MSEHLLHIFQNTPMGREVLLQSLYFVRKTEISLKVYIPRFRQFLMYLKNTVVTINLNQTFLHSPQSARSHAEEIIKGSGFDPDFITPNSFTSGKIPVLPSYFKLMCSPRSISDLSTKIGLGYIGPKVRSIIKNSTFPLLIPSTVYKKWENITVFFGGSQTAVNAVKLGRYISQTSELPLYIFTQGEKDSKTYYQEILEKNDLLKPINHQEVEWQFFNTGLFEENLYNVPHNSLVIVGTLGNNLVREVLFGSKAETLQTILPNNLLLVGPNYTP